MFLSCQANQCRTSQKQNIFLEGLEVKHMKNFHLENDKESAIKHFRLFICSVQKPGQKICNSSGGNLKHVLWGIAKNKISERESELSKKHERGNAIVKIALAK